VALPRCTRRFIVLAGERKRVGLFTSVTYRINFMYVTSRKAKVVQRALILISLYGVVNFAVLAVLQKKK
jgi:hypothetical protein